MRALGLSILGMAISFMGCAIESNDGQEDGAVSRTEDPYVDRQLEWLTPSSIMEAAVSGTIEMRVVRDGGVPSSRPYETWIDDSVRRWLAPLRTLPGGQSLAQGVTFVPYGEQLTVYVHAGLQRGSYVPQIFWWGQHIDLFDGDARGPTVVLHELGHAFGLGDTYVEGTWVCAPGQPSAVMCNSDSIDLRADDVRGIRHEYCVRTHRCDANDYLDQYGGPGGSPFTLTCALGERMVGVTARAGGFVDAIGPICESTWTGTRTRQLRAGGWGGGERSFECAKGAYVVAARIRSGQYVDSVQLRCSDGAESPRIGGDGGASDHWYTCPSSHVTAIGLRGAAGGYVDRLGLTCDASYAHAQSVGAQSTSGVLPK